MRSASSGPERSRSETPSYATMAVRMGLVDGMTASLGRISGIFVISANACQSYASVMGVERDVIVHRVEASLFPVNAYLVETSTGVVVVDATFGVSDGRRLRPRVDALRKPLAAVIITHSHPDHYGGVTPLLDGADVPVYAVAGVNEVIRRDDATKDQILRPMFGDEWPPVRTFPGRIVQGGERIAIADGVFTVTDLGSGESPHDSLWRLEA